MTDGGIGDLPGPDSVEAAMAYYEAQRWRQVRPLELRAALVLAEEVKRLRGLEAHKRTLVARSEAAVADAKAELSRYRDAISEIIGCAHHEGLACRRDNHGWHGCCLARLRAARLGIAAEPERRDEDDAA